MLCKCLIFLRHVISTIFTGLEMPRLMFIIVRHTSDNSDAKQLKARRGYQVDRIFD
jgi:hypothetical protein